MRRTIVVSIALLVVMLFVCSTADARRTCRPATCSPATCSPATCAPETCAPKTCRPRTCCPTTCVSTTCSPAVDGDMGTTAGNGQTPGTIGPTPASKEDAERKKDGDIIDLDAPDSKQEIPALAPAPPVAPKATSLIPGFRTWTDITGKYSARASKRRLGSAARVGSNSPV